MCVSGCGGVGAEAWREHAGARRPDRDPPPALIPRRASARAAALTCDSTSLAARSITSGSLPEKCATSGRSAAQVWKASARYAASDANRSDDIIGQ